MGREVSLFYIVWQAVLPQVLVQNRSIPLRPLNVPIPESFGIECGRLAQLPEDILQVASQRAAGMRKEIEDRRSAKKCVRTHTYNTLSFLYRLLITRL